MWQDGLLPQLLQAKHSARDITTPSPSSSSPSSPSPSSSWFILDGALTPAQLDTLLSFLPSGVAMTLADGRAVPVQRGHRFILEVGGSGGVVS